MARRALSRRLRFEIFKRDGFRCFYCGRTPLVAELQVDHVEPVARGGRDDGANLVTSCVACNSGKAAVPLTTHSLPVADPARVREQVKQIAAYLASQKDLDAVREKCVGQVRAAWEEGWPEGNTFREVSFFRNTLEWLPIAELVRAIRIATSRKPCSRTGCFRYLCGVVRNLRSDHAIQNPS